MSEGEFCVLCGRTGLPLEEGICADCFVKHHPLLRVRTHPRVVLCPQCGSRRMGDQWERSGAPEFLAKEDLLPLLEPLEGVGIRRVDFEEGGTHRLAREIVAHAQVRFRGTERSVPLRFEVRIEHETCPTCSRKSGGFYTAVIQLRGPEGRRRGSSRALREALRERWDSAIPDSKGEWRGALSWFEPLKEGWDFYLIDTEKARALSRWMRGRLRATLSESPSLWGRKDGREVYRVTFCLRVPLAEEELHPPEPAPGAPPVDGERPELPFKRQA